MLRLTNPESYRDYTALYQKVVPLGLGTWQQLGGGVSLMPAGMPEEHTAPHIKPPTPLTEQLAVLKGVPPFLGGSVSKRFPTLQWY